ncbi:MAG: YggS family pyridoxal phosphate-dependent enzyme [Halioglobus sp.]|nr:YggS family pyridoxal phosphate-dependent enzyme [Halioglobus sp.]
MDAQQLHDHITKLDERVRRSSQKSQYGNSDILVLAVSKTKPAEDIRAAHAAGLSHFGENYLQEALAKIEALSDLELTWHFIGPLQSNKTRAVAEHFDWVHTVDREKIARRLSQQRPPHLAPLNVCLQVNISGESTKSGVSLGELPDLAARVSDLPGIALRGLMTIPAPAGEGQDEEARRRPFRALREAFEALQAGCPEMDTLSMGMSADLEAAIAEGATIVRIGTALFGERER